jgi:subtilase family serine protease
VAASGGATGTLVRTANALPGLARAVYLGPTPASTELTVDIALARPHAAAEQSLLRAVSTPGNALYRHYLSPAQFASRFGVPAATVAATERWLQSGDLHVGYVSDAGDLVSARGTVARIGALMQTSFGNYRAGSVAFVANQEPPAVPAGLPITTVVGLNTLERMWTEPQVSQLDAKTLSASLPGISASSLLAGATQYTGELVPQDLWGVYDLPCSGQTDLSRCDAGQGEVAGVFGTGYSNGVVTNLRVWEQRVGLPEVPVRVVPEQSLPGGTPNDNDLLGEVEWNLDTQALTGMAPELARLDLYFASTGYDADVVQMFSAWAQDPQGPDVMNASFGECEADPLSGQYPKLPPLPVVGQGLLGNEMQFAGDAALARAAIEGRTLFSAAGDSGASCPAVILPVLSAGNGVLLQPAATDAWYPCSSVYVVCSGGTVVTTDGTTNPGRTGAPATDAQSPVSRQSEVTWMYTGGGPAFDVPEPYYQQGVANIDQPCTSPTQGDQSPLTPGTICRGVPDIAAMSGSGLVDQQVVGGANSYYTNEDMMPIGTGGTSLSSPLDAGMWSVIQAAAPFHAASAPPGELPVPNLGFANPLLYAVGLGSLGNAAADFTDITQGELPTGNGTEQPGPGWDYTSGWGALDVAHFIRDVDGNPGAVVTNPGYAPASAGPEQTLCAASGPLWLSSPGGNAYDAALTVEPPYTEDPQLDITQASFTLDRPDQALVVTIGGPNLSTIGPPDAVDGYTFYATWTYEGTTYFAAAAVDQPPNTPGVPGVLNSIPAPVSPPTRTVTYGDGVMDSFTPTFAHSDTGSFANGTFTITVPLANVGNPSVAGWPGPSELLQDPFVFDTLPNGVLVPFASDEAASAPPGQQVLLGRC